MTYVAHARTAHEKRASLLEERGLTLGSMIAAIVVTADRLGTLSVADADTLYAQHAETAVEHAYAEQLDMDLDAYTLLSRAILEMRPIRENNKDSIHAAWSDYVEAKMEAERDYAETSAWHLSRDSRAEMAEVSP